MTKLSGARNVIGMRQWEKREFGGVQVAAVPAIHWDIAIGYVIHCGNKNLYFAGDTFYGRFMSEIGRRFSLAAVIPVTTFRIPMTMGEQAAEKAVRAMQLKNNQPHRLYQSPRLPLLQRCESPEGFRQRLQVAGGPSRMALLPDGEPFTV